MANDAVRNLVREGKTRQLRNTMISGQQEGMQTIEMDLARLVASGIISFETAAGASAFPKEIMAQAATQRSQMQAQATVAAGQAATDRLRATASASDAELDMVAAKLPYKTLGGIVPCPGGWLIVPARLAGVTVNAEEPRSCATCIDVLEYKPKFDAAAIYAPDRVLRAARRSVPPVRRRGARHGRLATRRRHQADAVARRAATPRPATRPARSSRG